MPEWYLEEGENETLCSFRS